MESTKQTLAASAARMQWSHLLNLVARERTRILVEKSGVPVAAIVSADDLSRLEELEAQENRRLDAALARMREAFADVREEELSRQVEALMKRIRDEERSSPL